MHVGGKAIIHSALLQCMNFRLFTEYTSRIGRTQVHIFMELSERTETDETDTTAGLSETNSQLSGLDSECLFPDRGRKFSIHCQVQTVSDVVQLRAQFVPRVLAPRD
jgi:hypothetical protein